jgi:hypothetical protein
MRGLYLVLAQENHQLRAANEKLQKKQQRSKNQLVESGRLGPEIR